MAAPNNAPGIDVTPQIGYTALGNWMVADPDSETLVFRKFTRLTTRNLLFLQSEVIDLEALSDALDRELCDADEHLRHSMSRWETFVERAKTLNSPEFRYMQVNMKIRAKLKEYRTCSNYSLCLR
jgi:hypothetical protein